MQKNCFLSYFALTSPDQVLIDIFHLQVEQLHKIFKLCGSPPDDYWKKSKLPHATLFKPQQPYDSSLRQTFKDLPTTTLNLLETLLSVEPHKRGTASSALASEVTMQNNVIFHFLYLQKTTYKRMCFINSLLNHMVLKSFSP